MRLYCMTLNFEECFWPHYSSASTRMTTLLTSWLERSAIKAYLLSSTFQGQYLLLVYTNLSIVWPCWRALNAREVESSEVATALNKILGTGIQPPGLLDYALLALNSPEASLRKLAAQQVGACVVVSYKASICPENRPKKRSLTWPALTCVTEGAFLVLRHTGEYHSI